MFVNAEIFNNYRTFFLFWKICDTMNESSKENKKNVIPDDLILLFLQTIDDILNNRFVLK